MTYRQAQSLGAQVRKGERGSTIVYAKTIERVADESSIDERVTHILLLRAYTVFNSDQIDGLPTATETAPLAEPASARIDRADAFVAATKATILHKGNRACFIPSADRVELPPYAQFVDTPTASAAEGYYGTGPESAAAQAGARNFARRSRRRSKVTAGFNQRNRGRDR
jgi:antirestriction protein ArdC